MGIQAKFLRNPFFDPRVACVVVMHDWEMLHQLKFAHDVTAVEIIEAASKARWGSLWWHDISTSFASWVKLCIWIRLKMSWRHDLSWKKQYWRKERWMFWSNMATFSKIHDNVDIQSNAPLWSEVWRKETINWYLWCIELESKFGVSKKIRLPHLFHIAQLAIDQFESAQVSKGASWHLLSSQVLVVPIPVLLQERV